MITLIAFVLKILKQKPDQTTKNRQYRLPLKRLLNPDETDINKFADCSSITKILQLVHITLHTSSNACDFFML